MYRTQVQSYLNRALFREKFIFQYSQDCKRRISARSYGVLIERNPPQIKMPIVEDFPVVDKRIHRYNETTRSGYHNNRTHDTTNLEEKPVSFRCI